MSLGLMSMQTASGVSNQKQNKTAQENNATERGFLYILFHATGAGAQHAEFTFAW